GRSIRTSRLLVWTCGRRAPAWQRRFLGLIGYRASQWEAALRSGEGGRCCALWRLPGHSVNTRARAVRRRRRRRRRLLVGKTRLLPRLETHPSRGGLKSARMDTRRRALSFSERHQKLVDKNFRKSLHVQILNKLERQTRNQIVQNENDERVERKRFLRVLQNEQFELDMEEAIQKAEENKMLRDRQLEQEERLADELARLKHESLKDEKMRQQVRENSIELRELEQKLKAAYMNKERAAQIAERDAIKYEQMEEAEQKLRKQREMKQDFEDQMALREIILQAAKEEEETFRKAMLAKFAEDDRIELMNAQKQRMKQLEHKRAVEKLIEERRSQFLEDKKRELEELQLQQKQQGCINEIIEEERLRLLKEHAAKLLGYLPKGVFKREDDVDMLGEEFRKAYQKRGELVKRSDQHQQDG
ncbi:Meiosis-specific nuclear structural protein 1, partial [Lemmus lemmus]